jgi:hypothetical protein
MNSLNFLRNAGANTRLVAASAAAASAGARSTGFGALAKPLLFVAAAVAVAVAAVAVAATIWFLLTRTSLLQTARDTVESWFTVRNPREPIYWCYVGSEKAQRHCVRVPHKTLCADGVAFATRTECEAGK